jgi:acyl-CoA synthetase (AMP-forming)/AMP-acid ligase II
MHLTQSLHRAVQQRPNAIATIYGNRTRTVAESADRIARFAGALRSLGVGKGDRVAILSLNSDRYHEYFFAVPWLGAVVNPVNIRWSPAEIIYSLQDSGTKILLIDDAFAKALPAIQAQHELERVIFIGEGEAPAGTLDYETLVSTADPIEDTESGGDELLGIFYTAAPQAFQRASCSVTTTSSLRHSAAQPPPTS